MTFYSETDLKTKLVGCLVIADTNSYIIKNVSIQKHFNGIDKIYKLDLYFVNRNENFYYKTYKEDLIEWIEGHGENSIIGYDTENKE